MRTHRIAWYRITTHVFRKWFGRKCLIGFCRESTRIFCFFWLCIEIERRLSNRIVLEQRNWCQSHRWTDKTRNFIMNFQCGSCLWPITTRSSAIPHRPADPKRSLCMRTISAPVRISFCRRQNNRFDAHWLDCWSESKTAVLCVHWTSPFTLINLQITSITIHSNYENTKKKLLSTFRPILELFRCFGVNTDETPTPLCFRNDSSEFSVQHFRCFNQRTVEMKQQQIWSFLFCVKDSNWVAREFGSFQSLIVVLEGVLG